VQGRGLRMANAGRTSMVTQDSALLSEIEKAD
jgi:hypothetical protein